MRSAARRRREAVELLVDALHAPGEPLRLGQQRRHAALAAPRDDRLRPAAGGGQQAVHAAQALALARERRALLLGGVECLDLVDLEGQQVQIADARAGALAQLGQRRLELPHARVRRAEAPAQRQLVAAAEAVEQVELGRGEREAAVLVLAEEGDQAAAERLQVGRRGRAALHERARSALGRDPARQDDLVERVVDALPQLRQLGVVEQPVGQGEHALDVGLARARPDDAGARLAAQQQVERVGEHGLARAGLPGERAQALARAQLGALDQQQVLDP